MGFRGLNASVRCQHRGVRGPRAAFRAAQHANLGLRGDGRRFGRRPLSLPLRRARVRPDLGAAVERAGIRRHHALGAASRRVLLDFRRPLPRSAGLDCGRARRASVRQLRTPRWPAACCRFFGVARLGGTRAAGAGVRELSRGIAGALSVRCARACRGAGHLRVPRRAARAVVLGCAYGAARFDPAESGADVARRCVASRAVFNRHLPYAALPASGLFGHCQSRPRRLGRAAADA